MPYISQFRREAVGLGGWDNSQNAGELNYTLTLLVHDYWERNGKDYQAFNDILGALEGCKLELYRRKVAPYEDAAMERNGDV